MRKAFKDYLVFSLDFFIQIASNSENAGVDRPGGLHVHRTSWRGDGGVGGGGRGGGAESESLTPVASETAGKDGKSGRAAALALATNDE